MPLYDDAVSKEVLLEESIAQLADQYGPDAFQRMLFRFLPTSSSNDTTKHHEEVLLEDAITHYFDSDAFQSLAKSSQQAYRYEMDLFMRHCHRTKGSNPNTNHRPNPILLIMSF